MVALNEFAWSLNRNCNTNWNVFNGSFLRFIKVPPFNHLYSVKNLQDEIHDKVIFNKFAENIPEWFEKL